MSAPRHTARGSLHTVAASTVGRVLLALVMVAPVVLAPAPSAAAGSDDYRQVVDITFPFEAHVDVRYRDDYDAPRSSTRMHQATDLMVAGGTPVHAAMGGTVTWLSGDRRLGPPSYGWMVRIAGDDGRDYAYVHLGWQDRPWEDAYAPGIERGARVDRGQLLGWAGCSGSASCGGGEHLHFEIHDESVVDPYDHHDHERINPYRSLVAAEQRGDYPFDGTFRDVSSASVHRRNIEKLAASGITKGCGTDRFCPEDPVTRQQMASFLTRALDLAPAGDPGFTDVAASNVHGADIASLAAAGITKGCGDDRFCPTDAVTREQMASFLVRALGLPAATTGGFSDVAPGDVHAGTIAALAAAGITKGCSDDRFCPTDPVTREQMASFLVRALDL